ncbi:MAG TPA: 2-oxo-4-hydroxy-4-carboxy-5-ureidoimidazoline decarboxylase [Candidatus Sulfotelmatobacter sp.]|nr:2-oxo-4-hydroxy-4-carboxy-5-ureidoimidazoline decarboxylase [Candidatus Sulfotelmatobacter sp.]
MTLAQLNALTDAEAHAALERCCGSACWVREMMAARPFKDVRALHAAADRAFARLEREDWLEAFAHHPMIGDVESLRAKFASTAAWAGEEQRGAAMADEMTLLSLANENRAYRDRFGYIFIVCATGKTAAQMLEMLRERSGHDPETELEVAAGEQRKIAKLRLEKLLAESS